MPYIRGPSIDLEEWALPLEIYTYRVGRYLRLGIRILVFEWVICWGPEVRNGTT
jgi:hypothetical protein